MIIWYICVQGSEHQAFFAGATVTTFLGALQVTVNSGRFMGSLNDGETSEGRRKPGEIWLVFTVLSWLITGYSDFLKDGKTNLKDGDNSERWNNIRWNTFDII